MIEVKCARPAMYATPEGQDSNPNIVVRVCVNPVPVMESINFPSLSYIYPRICCVTSTFHCRWIQIRIDISIQ